MSRLAIDRYPLNLNFFVFEKLDRPFEINKMEENWSTTELLGFDAGLGGFFFFFFFTGNG